MKFKTEHPIPEGLERELLTILNEECHEVGQRICKSLRFGLEEVQPGQNLTNAERIGMELGDLIEVMEWLVDRGVIPESAIHQGRIQKSQKLPQFLQFLEPE